MLREGLLQAVSRDQAEIPTCTTTPQHASHLGPVWALDILTGMKPSQLLIFACFKGAKG